MAWPIVIATNGYGIPVRESDSEYATPYEIAENGMGTPVVFTDSEYATPVRNAVPTPWSPIDLGDDLIAWWSADRDDLMTLNTAEVASWLDVVAGYELVQSTAGNRPAYSATSWNGLPGVTFDGSNDRLEMTPLPAAFPSGDDPSEIWALASQDFENSTSGNKYLVSYGGAGGAVLQRGIRREIQEGDNVALVFVGNGSTGLTNRKLEPVYFGRHLARGIIGATECLIELDGSEAPAPTAAVPATGTDWFRIGATASGGAGGFWSGVVRDVVITHPLGSEQAEELRNYLLGAGLLEMWVG